MSAVGSGNTQDKPPKGARAKGAKDALTVALVRNFKAVRLVVSNAVPEEHGLELRQFRSKTYGWVVMSVTQGSWAASVGIKAGDLLLHVRDSPGTPGTRLAQFKKREKILSVLKHCLALENLPDALIVGRAKDIGRIPSIRATAETESAAAAARKKSPRPSGAAAASAAAAPVSASPAAAAAATTSPSAAAAASAPAPAAAPDASGAVVAAAAAAAPAPAAASVPDDDYAERVEPLFPPPSKPEPQRKAGGNRKMKRPRKTAAATDVNWACRQWCVRDVEYLKRKRKRDKIEVTDPTALLAESETYYALAHAKHVMAAFNIPASLDALPADAAAAAAASPSPELRRKRRGTDGKRIHSQSYSGLGDRAARLAEAQQSERADATDAVAERKESSSAAAAAERVPPPNERFGAAPSGTAAAAALAHGRGRDPPAGGQ